ncbi:hypothetical protein RI129_004505 [Pyrocoelia pectoralis]|uniref:Uncharacterized protein n=1 Tax=Pyrocoelia pectoralis TaxID=417401 RepID=A0AAN7ZQS1_9COLE
MKKAARSSVWIGKLHKGFVLTCIGVTVLALGNLSWGALRYFITVRPERKKLELLEKQELLAEGSSENVKDSALM